MIRVGIALAVTTPIPTDGEIVYSQGSSTTFISPLCYHKEVCLRGPFTLYNLYFMLYVSLSLTTSDVLVSVSITGDSILIEVSTSNACMSRVGVALAVTTPIPTDGEIVYSQGSLTTFIFSLCVYKGMGKYPFDTSYTSCISQCGAVLMCILLLTFQSNILMPISITYNSIL
jgi:hypothetical protein